MSESKANAKPAFLSSKTWIEVEVTGDLKAKLEEGFKHLDKDDSGSVSMEEAEAMFKSFKKLGVTELLEAMDEDGDGFISLEEWMFYFKKVKQTGLYQDEEIIEEVDMFLEGYGFMKFETDDGNANNADGEAKDGEAAAHSSGKPRQSAKEQMEAHHGRIN